MFGRDAPEFVSTEVLVRREAAALGPELVSNDRAGVYVTYIS